MVLVARGQARAAIIRWERRPSPVVDLAAKELRSYVQRMTGARLPIVAGYIQSGTGDPGVDGAVVIRTGSSAASLMDGGRSAGLDGAGLAEAASMTAGLPEDAYATTARGDDLVLSGNTERATLYAVYALLRRMGCRFFAPNFAFYRGHAERIPRRRTLVVPRTSHASAPDFRYRRQYVLAGISLTPATLSALIQWMPKARLNVLAYPTDLHGWGLVRWDTWRTRLLSRLEERGIVVEAGEHGYQTFLPPEIYGAAHPDWFVPGYNVFDVSKSSAVTQYVSNVVDYLRDHPEVTIFDTWPPDSARWPPNAIASFGSAANAQAYLTERLRHEVASSVPGVRVEAVAYFPALSPPDQQFMYDENDLIDLAPYNRSYRVAIDGAARANEQFVDTFRRWRTEFQGDIGVFEYYAKYLWHSLPVTLPQLMARDLRFYRSVGATGMGMSSEAANWIPYELSHLLLTDLEWNSRLNVGRYVSSYLSDRYGTAAPFMHRYLDVVDQAGRALWPNATGDYGRLSAVSRALHKYLRAERHLRGAIRVLPPRSSKAFVVRRLRWNLNYAVLDTATSYWALRGRPPLSRRAAQAAEALVRKHRLDGSVLDSFFAGSRYGDGVPAPRAHYYDIYREAW